MDIAPYKTDNTFKYTTVSAAGEIASATKAEVIWQESIGFITSATISGTTLTVNKQAGVYGNALVGIYDSSNNLLWSFHIWCPEDNIGTPLNYTVTFSGDTYTLLPMAIGGIKRIGSAASDEDKVKAFGLFYQWGRKDPLGRPNGVSTALLKPVYDKDGNQFKLTDATYIKNISDVLAGYTDEATDGPKSHFIVKYAAKHPMEMLLDLSTQYKGIWSCEENNYFWGNFRARRSYPKKSKTYKSIFDPSPAGYRVAPEDTWVNFNTLKSNTNDKTTFNVVGNETFDWTSTNNNTKRGYSFYYQAIGSGHAHFIGAPGFRRALNGLIINAGTRMCMWTSSRTHTNFNSTYINVRQPSSGSSGMIVYCVQE